MNMGRASTAHPVARSFKDWAGESIAYRVRDTRAEEEREPHERVTCEINPHGDSWHLMGRGRTEQQALASAVEAWNDFDQR